MTPVEPAAVDEVVVARAHREIAVRSVGVKSPSAPATIAWIESGKGAPSCAFAEQVALALATIEHKARRETEPRWVAAATRLPDSDVRVLVRHIDGDVLTAELEFTDDSGGHGKPHWDDYGRALSIEHYPHWMPLPSPPPGGASDD